MNLKISKKSPLLWLYVGGALLLLVAMLLWWIKLSNNPSRVFWGTINRSLATQAVTIQANQTNQGTTADQTIRYSLGGDSRSHSITKLTQGATTVENEMVGTPDADYTRYLSVKTDQKRHDGKPIDTSKLIGVWAKGQMGSGQFFAQAVLGASLPIGGMGVPIGNLQPEARGKLVKQIQSDSVYQIDFTKVKKERAGGRMQYTYDASVQTIGYVKMMKQFAQNLGLHGLDQVDPASYKGQQPFKLRITIDVLSRQVVRITSPDTGATQAYSSYGVPVQIEVPKNAITGAELQKILNSLQ